jgi:hypothetical protein
MAGEHDVLPGHMNPTTAQCHRSVRSRPSPDLCLHTTYVTVRWRRKEPIMVGWR